MRFEQIGTSALILILSIFLVSGAWAGELSQHPGYLGDTSDERYQVSREVVIVAPKVTNEVSLKDQIFTKKITKEFKQRYEERFGRTEAQQVFNTPSQFFETEFQPGVFRTAEEVAEEQRDFGNYVMKRTAEYHIDRWMKESPNARPLYELKEKVSNVSVEVKPGYKVRVKYSLSSDDLSLRVKNPLKLDNRVIYNLADSQTRLFLAYPVTKKVTVSTDYNFDRDEYSVSGHRRLNQFWSASLTGSETFRDDSLDYDRKAILGLSWRD